MKKNSELGHIIVGHPIFMSLPENKKIHTVSPNYVPLNKYCILWLKPEASRPRAMLIWKGVAAALWTVCHRERVGSTCRSGGLRTSSLTVM